MGGGWFRARIRRRLLLAVTLGLSSRAHSAEVEPTSPRQSEPFRLVWSSSAGCGSARTFLAELAGRTALLRPARDDERAITLIVDLFRAEGGVRGQLTLRKRDGELTVREVPGKDEVPSQDCLEVESAMALIAALMVDPLAGSSEPPNVEGPETPLPSSESASVAAKSAWSFRAEQRLTARSAIAPGLTWGPALGVVLTREASALHPSVGVSALTARATTSASQGSAELAWTAAQLALCPLGFQPDTRWDLRACVSLQLGRLRGTGFATGDPASKAIVWSSAGLELQARYQLLGPLWLGFDGGLILPFSRESFYLEGGPTLHQVPATAISFGAGLGLRFF